MPLRRLAVTSFVSPTHTGKPSPTLNAAPASPPCHTSVAVVSVGRELSAEVRDYTETQLSEFLITCARAVNEAAKRNDLEAVHALVHAEASALIELNSRWAYFGWAGERDRQRMEGRVA